MKNVLYHLPFHDDLPLWQDEKIGAVCLNVGKRRNNLRKNNQKKQDVWLRNLKRRRAI